jgi:hypothetical protein
VYLCLIGKTHRNEKIRHSPLILLPCFTVLFTASVDISPGAVDDHDDEKDGIKPGEWRLEARDEAPGDGEEGVAGVVDLACFSICEE